ncbi:YybH family protein [Tatumella citrea]|uniref:DUF4440 domain-containing protein n=1 Tax=Tatumella citrea TaxID=53336 RepID=A0A1Y0LC74_TATCI|nr:SgcJ/EcaC family oxidoreductase [Tatumella citrea]ARU95198.1 DUF4440 domain-containing protein [Tatumella citrea]ARU99238.1 DUF4440 domain-containing protein [Tatumella citrea]
MTTHPVRQIIEDCDRAISAGDFDAVMEYYTEDAALVIKPGMIARGKADIRKAFGLISDYFQGQLQVTQGDMQVIEGGGDVLVIMESRLKFPGPQGEPVEINRRATYVFRKEPDGRWLCSIDNSYGTDLLNTETV